MEARTEAEIDDLQGALAKLPPGHPFAMVMRRAKDMATPNGIAMKRYMIAERHQHRNGCLSH